MSTRFKKAWRIRKHYERQIQIHPDTMAIMQLEEIHLFVSARSTKFQLHPDNKCIQLALEGFGNVPLIPGETL